jgi:hypothetical protein
VAEKDDVCFCFFVGTQRSIVVTVKQLKDCLVRSLAVAILENANEGILGKRMQRLLREEDGTLVGIVVPDKSSNEADNDVAGCGRPRPDNASISCVQKLRSGQKDQSSDRKSNSCEPRHAEAPVP